MEVSRFRQPVLWLIVVACVISCATPTPLAGTTSVPAPTATTTLALTAPLAAAAPATPPDYWPTEGWRTSTPEEQGVDSTQLERMFDAIDDQQLDIHSVLVVRNGYIIAETYYPPFQQDTKHHVYSVTKSIISALIGIAIEEGYIDSVDDRVVDFFPEREFANPDGRKETMTLAHLLTMTSGLDWQEGMLIYQAMGRTKDLVDFVLDKPITAQPGSQFNYCSGCSHVMSAIIQDTTGMGTLEFAQRHLFEPLGISNVYWETDRSGIPNGGWGLNLTPRDMAKLGYLYLNDGVWDDQQIVPAAWVRRSVEGHITFDDGWGYGYQWWIYPSFGAYAAIGLGAQLIFVMPDWEMVVVFTATLGDSDVLFGLIEDFIVPEA
jgi:CubicO group peptidase (beta-lactamase class C family)